jgi:hypothetical protein
MNKNNHLKITGMMAHKNPLICPLFAMALFLLFRFKEGERFPDFLNKEDYFRRWLFCSSGDPEKV